MIELMLKLLTYEPYEVVSGDEKDYIDKVLSEKFTSDTAVTNKEYIIYDAVSYTHLTLPTKRIVEI